MMKTFKTMMKIELKLSLRGMDMLLFAICMPVVVLVILGMLYGDKQAFTGADYTFLEQSFGALATISICAGGVMGLPLVVSDYRDKRILKRFQVTPVSPPADSVDTGGNLHLVCPCLPAADLFVCSNLF